MIHTGAGSEQLLEFAMEKQEPCFLCGKNKPLVTSESSWWPWPSSEVCQEELMLHRGGGPACHGQRMWPWDKGMNTWAFGFELRPLW